MSKLFRALLISAIATGTVVVFKNMMQRHDSRSNSDDSGQNRFVEAEKLSDEERALLSDELDAML